MSKTLGIIGGMGTFAGECFLNLVMRHTKAETDNDRIDVIMTSFPSAADRSDFILGKSTSSPLESIKRSIEILSYGGAQVIAMPCNTATYFLDEIKKYSQIPILNIVELTVSAAYRLGAKKVGILATSGTVYSGIYQKECAKYGIEAIFPENDEQSAVVNDIYLCLKSRGNSNGTAIHAAQNLIYRGCDQVIFGCTELSLVDVSNCKIKDKIIDSSTALAKAAIEACGKVAVGFDKIYD
ncbi:MAG: aspartate/glutamate racemase family protein [Clostridiales bacterium]|nr:aspartate/glutamate racemase family protein [Clostridiales bacterium]